MRYRTEVFELPCGFVSEEGGFFPYLEVREMTGAEEDILSDRRKVKNGSAINQLLASCCKLLADQDGNAKLDITEEMARAMTQGDRMAALLWVRKVSYGDKYVFTLKCSNDSCSKKNTFELLLSTLDLVKMKEPLKRVYDVSLPSSKDTVTFKISTGVEEQKMERMREQNSGKEATINLAARLVSVNGKTVNPIEYLVALTVTDRDAYRKAVEAVEGGIKTRIEGPDFECRSCGQDLSTDLPIQESFFSPTSG